MTLAWHKRYHDDALTGYMGLTLEERGLYTTVLDLLYARGPVPFVGQERFLAGWCQVPVQRVKKLVSGLVQAGKLTIREDGALTNARYEKERAKTAEIVRAQSEGGAKSAVKAARKRASENPTLQKTCPKTYQQSDQLFEKFSESFSELLEPKPSENKGLGESILDRDLQVRARINPEAQIINPPIGKPIEGSAPELFAAYRSMATSLGLPVPKKLTDARRRALVACLREHGPESWAEALAKARASPFLRGENDRSWAMDFDWFVKKANFLKVLEGKYDERRTDNRPRPAAPISERLRSRMAPVPPAGPGGGEDGCIDLERTGGGAYRLRSAGTGRP